MIASFKTAGDAPITAQAGGKVLKVRQQDTALALDLEGGSVAITTAEASSSVMLRSKAGVMEYAD